MSNYVNSLRESSLRQAHIEVDTVMRDYYRLLTELSNNSQVSGNVANISVWDVNYQLAQRALREELKRQVSGQEGILGIALIANNREYVFYDRTSLSALHSYSFDFPAILESELVKRPQQVPGTQMLEQASIGAGMLGDRNVLYLAYSVSDLENLERLPIGTVVLCLDEKAVEAVYAGALNDDDNSLQNVTWVMDLEGNVLSASDDILLGRNIFDGQANRDTRTAVDRFVMTADIFAQERFSIQIAEDEGSDYILVNLENQDIYMQQIYTQGIWILIAGMLLILIVSVSINYTSKKIDKDVHSIVYAMNQANAGQLDVRIDNVGEDEFAQISSSFNEMIREMRDLIEREKAAEDSKRRAEIQALEAQINPHFLYNTLDSINWVAIEHSEYEVSKMLMYLALILRYSISKSNEVVTLREELDYLQKYIYLQQHRFRYSFASIVRVDDELLDCRIHKLLMQPLIENCIEHAFPGPTGDDLIEIDIKQLDKKRLQIIVADNGKGMADEWIASLNRGDIDGSFEPAGIGLRNVIRRIKIYYGESGSFHVRRNGSQGCRIILTISYETVDG